MTPEPTPPHGLHVVCLCADWCGTCRDYAHTFAELARAHDGARFDWVDVEDDAGLAGELEVENFPTLLIGVAGTPVFFGTLPPHAATLARLLQQAPELPPLPPGEPTDGLRELLDQLQRRPA
jgi:thioredoxin 1